MARILLAILDVALLLGFLGFVVTSQKEFWLPRRAKRRARKLFLSKLDVGQRRSWELARCFDVNCASGNRYTISPYRTFNIRNATEEFCLLLEANIPAYDKLLAQRLLIEADECLFLTLANRRQRYR
jgi:hypothetical protein